MWESVGGGREMSGKWEWGEDAREYKRKRERGRVGEEKED